jgi:hypothetical protein
MVQIIASANSVYDIPWPTSFASFLDVMKLFLVDLITVRADIPSLLLHVVSCIGGGSDAVLLAINPSR